MSQEQPDLPGQQGGERSRQLLFEDEVTVSPFVCLVSDSVSVCARVSAATEVNVSAAAVSVRTLVSR